MAALLPILQEILPMLMPGPVHITKADTLRPLEGEGEEEGEQEGEGDGEDAREDAREGAREGAREEARDGPAAERLPRPPRPPRPPRRPPNGVSLRDAIVHQSGSLCASVLTVQPQSATVVFHNGEQDALVYAVSGTAVLATLPEDFDEWGGEEADDDRGARKRPAPATHTIGAGDFALIPAWTEHQVRNEGAAGAADVVWVVVRNAAEPTVVPLQGWGGGQA